MYENMPNTMVNPALIQNLNVIAQKNHPSSGYAQAFHYYLTDEFVDNLDLTFLETEGYSERRAEINQSNIQSNEISIFPNPASAFINITNSHQIQSMKIYNSNGFLVQQAAKVSKLNTQNWSGGIYIFAIQKVDGTFMMKNMIVNK